MPIFCGVPYIYFLGFHLHLASMICLKIGQSWVVKINSLLLIAASALVWTIWLTRNEIVFDKCKLKSLLQVLFRRTHWLQQWAILQRHEDLKDLLISATTRLETSALVFFSSNGWLMHRYVGFV